MQLKHPQMSFLPSFVILLFQHSSNTESCCCCASQHGNSYYGESDYPYSYEETVFWFVAFIPSWINPFLYLCTSQSFRQFTVRYFRSFRRQSNKTWPSNNIRLEGTFNHTIASDASRVDSHAWPSFRNRC